MNSAKRGDEPLAGLKVRMDDRFGAEDFACFHPHAQTTFGRKEVLRPNADDKLVGNEKAMDKTLSVSVALWLGAVA